MRVLQLVPRMNIGGVETGTLDLVRILRRQGHECYVVSAGGSLVGELIKAGAKHITMPVDRKSLFSLALVGDLVRLIERESIDIVHARSRVPAWIGFFAARRSARPFITTCHGYYSTHFLSRVMGWGKQVIVISNLIGRHMIEDFGVPPERITLIHRGVDLSRFSFIPDRYDHPPKHRLIITCIGRIAPIKGQLYFVRAIYNLLHDYPNIEAWLIGSPRKENDAYYINLRRLVREWQLTEHIKFLGARHDIPELLKETDIVVMPSICPEGFGRAAIEAGASGIACVATQVGAVPEVIEHGVNGLLVVPNDGRELARAISSLISDRKLCKQLAHNLHSKVEKEFSLEKMAKKTHAVYEEATKKKRVLFLKLGAVGDLILAIPSLRMIRKKFPNAFLTLCVDPRLLSLVTACPYVDEIVTFDRRRGKRLSRLFQLARLLRQRAFDISIDFQNATWTHLLAFLGGVPERFGYKRHWSGRLLNRGVDYTAHSLPPVEHQFNILKRLGVTGYDDRLEIWTSKEEDERIESLLQSTWLSSGQKLVGIVCGSSRRWLTKRWPVESFAQLAKRLASSFGMRTVLIGHRSEKALVREFMRHYSEGVIDCVGRTSMSELVSLIKRLDLVICGDTAPLHIAAALNIPTLSLFGPTDPRRHMPPHSRGRFIYRGLPCSPCYQTKCDSVACLKNISVSEAFQAVCDLIGQHENTPSYNPS